MSFNINKGLVEAYQQVHLNEVKVVQEFKTYLLEEFSNQGYELTEEVLEQVLLDEGIASLAAPLLKLFKGAGGIAKQAVTNPRMRAAAQRFTQQAGPNIGKVLQKTGKAIGDVYTASKPAVKATGKFLTSPKGMKTVGALGGIEAATSLYTGQPSATVAGIGNLVGGAGNVIKYAAGKPMSAMGFPSTEKIGDVIKSLGKGVQDFNQRNKGKASTTTSTPSPTSQSNQRFEYDAQGRITGFKEDSDVDLENYLIEVLINDGFASNQNESIELLNQVVEYISEAQELVFQNNKPGIMVAKDGNKVWKEIDPKKFPNYKEMEASYIQRRGKGQIEQDIKTAQQMSAAQAKAREDKKKQQQQQQQKPEQKKPEEQKPEGSKTQPTAPPPKPKASVLAKEKGVTGEIGAEGKFKAKEWSAAEKERYETRRGAEQLKKDSETVAQIKTDRTETKPEEKPQATPAPEQPKSLEDLRKASAKATMAGPSKEAQELMSGKAKGLLGKEKLEAGVKAQKEVETMKNKMEEYDAFDNIRDFLIYGGYAQNISEASEIMVNMNDEWKNYILELFNE